MTESSPPQGAFNLLTSMAPMAIGLITLFAALAYYMGWQYTRAYYGEFQIPFSALEFSPQDLIVSSRRTILLALAPFAGGLAGRSTAILVPIRHDGVRATFSGIRGGLRAFYTISVPAIIAVDLIFAHHGAWTWGGVALGTYWLEEAWEARTERTRDFIVAITILALALFTLVVLLVPQELGRRDARKAIDDPSRFPFASFHYREPIEDGDVRPSMGFVVLRNSGLYWVMPEDVNDHLRVFSVPESTVAYIEYFER